MLRKLSLRLKKFERSTCQVLIVGLLARLFVMPFTAHSDLMQTYWNAHLVAYHHDLALGLQTLLRLFHTAYLWLITPVLPLKDTLWIHNPDYIFSSPFFSAQVASSRAWFDFISHPQVYRTLFLLKLPYVFFDLACAFLIYQLESDRAKSRLMFKFWWLNPILIFATYIFGRHEVIALFFILLSIYLLKEGKWQGGLLTLGMAIAIRYYSILLLPYYTLSLGSAWKKRVQGLLIGLTPWIIINLLNWSIAGSLEAKGLINLPHIDYLLSMEIEVAAWDILYIFPFLYFLLLLHRLYNREFGLQSLVQYNLIALLLMFTTAYTGQSPHYWAWLLPWLAIGVAQDRRLLPLHVVQIICLIVYSFIGGRSTAGYLFAPISPDFFWSLPSPVEFISRFASAETVISLIRTALSAVTLWMAYLVLRSVKTSFSTTKVSNNG